MIQQTHTYTRADPIVGIDLKSRLPINEGADRVRGRGRRGAGGGRRGGGRREKRGWEEGEEGAGGGRGEGKREGGERREILRARSARRSRREEGDEGAR